MWSYWDLPQSGVCFRRFRRPYNRYSGLRRIPASYFPGYGDGVGRLDSGFRRNGGWGSWYDGWGSGITAGEAGMTARGAE